MRQHLLYTLVGYLHNTSKKALALLHPAVLQALQMCNPLFLDFTLTYFRSPLGSTCTSALGTMLVITPLSSNIHLIFGLSGPRARHDSVALLPSSTVMLLGTIVNTGESGGGVTVMLIKQMVQTFLALYKSQVDVNFKTQDRSACTCVMQTCL